MRQEDNLKQVIQPAIESCGYVLWGLEYLPRKSSGLLRVYIDHENGILIEDCESASKQISSVLDVEDPLSGAYDLEVSSPGLDRKFFYMEQYESYIGQDILVKLWAPVQNKKKFQAKLIKVDVENEKLSFSFKDSAQKDLASLDDLDLNLIQIKQANLFIDGKIFSK